MKIDGILHPDLLDAVEEGMRGGGTRETSLVVVIDVLRFTTSLVRALEAGAREVIPVSTVKEALERARARTPRPLLCGERGGLTIEGFDHGNSPREYARADLGGRRLVYTTTNGTRAFERVARYPIVVAGSFINAAAVVAYVAGMAADLTHLLFLCAGREGTFSLEDTCCAGRLIDGLVRMTGEEYAMSDAARAAVELYRSHGDDLEAMLAVASGGRSLIRVGLGGDLRAAASEDSSHVVPFFERGSIRRANGEGGANRPWREL